ncbi:hypothetical protein [Rubellicoccus peritrichatus]|uniref:Uncharacterized protein n=1 Tax=Rubellicoccus peritrichatus TaxID=3080537 RepID=A0AAQ3LC10_9BACT|nr:hypothetical protein [Puniceicoccus sp. CR14]WOO42537.1 hypothetical protein RZN69_05500 [Puniceicoccus sp. CR14]
MTEMAAKASPLFSLGNAAGGLIVLGVGIHLAGFLIFRVVAEPTHEPILQEPFVKLLPRTVEASGALNESALLSDSEPLFLPTKWNASASPVQTSTTANQASPFDAFAAEIQMGTDESGTMFDTKVLIPQSPLEGLELNPGSVFSSFGQDVSLDVGGRIPGIKVDVHDYTTGEIQISETLDSSGLTIELPEEWRFVEFRVAVDSLGHVGRPVLVDGTGDESVDRALSDYLHSANAVSKLPPGYYRIVLGP